MTVLSKLKDWFAVTPNLWISAAVLDLILVALWALSGELLMSAVWFAIFHLSLILAVITKKE